MQTEEQLRFTENAVDHWIAREMGRPGSTFHEAELKNEIIELFPNMAEDVEADEEEEGSDDDSGES